MCGYILWDSEMSTNVIPFILLTCFLNIDTILSDLQSSPVFLYIAGAAELKQKNINQNWFKERVQESPQQALITFPNTNFPSLSTDTRHFHAFTTLENSTTFSKLRIFSIHALNNFVLTPLISRISKFFLFSLILLALIFCFPFQVFTMLCKVYLQCDFIIKSFFFFFYFLKFKAAFCATVSTWESQLHRILSSSFLLLKACWIFSAFCCTKSRLMS